MLKNFNIWLISSLLISISVLIPIITVFFSFFEESSNYYQILQDTFLLAYIFNSHDNYKERVKILEESDVSTVYKKYIII